MLKLSSIRSFFFLFTSPLRTFSGALTKPCSFPIPCIGLYSSCCCQVYLAKFCNMNCAGLLITSLWSTGVWVILLPYFKIFICHWVWCACHLEERCHSLIFLLLTFSLRILKQFLFSLPFFPPPSPPSSTAFWDNKHQGLSCCWAVLLTCFSILRPQTDTKESVSMMLWGNTLLPLKDIHPIKIGSVMLFMKPCKISGEWQHLFYTT